MKHLISQNTDRTDLRHAPRSCPLFQNGKYGLPDADLIVPDIKCFIIVLIDGWVQTIRIEPYFLC